MSKGDIKLSPKHGVNPSMICCPICGEPVSIALLGKIENDKEAPKKIVGTELCEKCIECCGDDKIFILGINRDSDAIMNYVQVYRTSLKIDIPGYLAVADANELFNLVSNK